jgi:hypothetical protein
VVSATYAGSPAAVGVSRLSVYDWPTVEGLPGFGTPRLHLTRSEGYVATAGVRTPDRAVLLRVPALPGAGHGHLRAEWPLTPTARTARTRGFAVSGLCAAGAAAAALALVPSPAHASEPPSHSAAASAGGAATGAAAQAEVIGEHTARPRPSRVVAVPFA